MSLVGPRPPLPHEVDLYESRQRRRISVRPGAHLPLADPRAIPIPFAEWLDLDFHYIHRWTLGLDFCILLCTPLAAASARRRSARRGQGGLTGRSRGCRSFASCTHLRASDRKIRRDATDLPALRRGTSAADLHRRPSRRRPRARSGTCSGRPRRAAAALQPPGFRGHRCVLRGGHGRSPPRSRRARASPGRADRVADRCRFACVRSGRSAVDSAAVRTDSRVSRRPSSRMQRRRLPHPRLPWVHSTIISTSLPSRADSCDVLGRRSFVTTPGLFARPPRVERCLQQLRSSARRSAIARAVSAACRSSRRCRGDREHGRAKRRGTDRDGAATVSGDRAPAAATALLFQDASPHTPSSTSEVIELAHASRCMRRRPRRARRRLRRLLLDLLAPRRSSRQAACTCLSIQCTHQVDRAAMS